MSGIWLSMFFQRDGVTTSRSFLWVSQSNIYWFYNPCIAHIVHSGESVLLYVCYYLLSFYVHFACFFLWRKIPWGQKCSPLFLLSLLKASKSVCNSSIPGKLGDLSILMNQSTDKGCASKGLNYPENQAHIHSSGFSVFTGQFTQQFESLCSRLPHVQLNQCWQPPLSLSDGWLDQGRHAVWFVGRVG